MSADYEGEDSLQYGAEESGWESFKSALKIGAATSLLAYGAWMATDYADTSLENVRFNRFGVPSYGVEEHAAEQMEEWQDESLPYKITHLGEYLAYESME